MDDAEQEDSDQDRATDLDRQGSLVADEDGASSEDQRDEAESLNGKSRCPDHPGHRRSPRIVGQIAPRH